MKIYSDNKNKRRVKQLKKDEIDLFITGNAVRSLQKVQDILIEEDSSESSESMSDFSVETEGSQVFQQVQELSKELYRIAQYSTHNSHRLEYDTINSLFRKAQDDHIPLNPEIQNQIALRCRKSPFGAFKRPKIDIYSLLYNDFDIAGLIPGLSPDKQLEILKIKERLLLIDRWEEVWNQVRPPKNNWYNLANKEFSFELSRHNQLLKSKKLRNLEYQTRDSLIGLYHNLSFYSAIRDQSKNY